MTEASSQNTAPKHPRNPPVITVEQVTKWLDVPVMTARAYRARGTPTAPGI